MESTIKETINANFHCPNRGCTKKGYGPIRITIDEGQEDNQECPYCGHKYLKMCGQAAPPVHGSEAGRMDNMTSYMKQRQQDHLNSDESKFNMAKNEEIEMNNLGFSKKK